VRPPTATTPVRRKILWTAAAISLCLSFLPTPARSQTTKPLPRIEQALIISIDGLRPDVFLCTRAPRLTSLYRGGTFTFWARSNARLNHPADARQHAQFAADILGDRQLLAAPYESMQPTTNPSEEKL
jgi:hypothetical protein